MIFKAAGLNQTNAGVIRLRCPGCRRQGSFDAISNVQDVVIAGTSTYFGLRRCPNPSCYCLVFFVLDSNTQKIIVSYPPERLDFEPVGIPAPVVSAFEEAITCHANRCFVAAAIMIRKTLEELCRDRNAKGENLKARIKALQSQVTLPPRSRRRRRSQAILAVRVQNRLLHLLRLGHAA